VGRKGGKSGPGLGTLDFGKSPSNTAKKRPKKRREVASLKTGKEQKKNKQPKGKVVAYQIKRRGGKKRGLTRPATEKGKREYRNLPAQRARQGTTECRHKKPT